MHFVSDGETCRLSIFFIDRIYSVGNRILNLTRVRVNALMNMH